MMISGLTRQISRAAIVLSALMPQGATVAGKEQDRRSEAQRMVAEQLVDRGIRDERVLQAMAAVARHRFVPDDQQRAAYWDGPLPIGFGQTISQPYIVAFMTEALAPGPTDVVLE